MDKIVMVVGPTAGGKTALSINIAKALNGEIISADSVQLYKGMDIGSATPTRDEMQGIAHHLVSQCNPRESFTAAEYTMLAKTHINDIIQRGRVPIVVGGTGLYADAILYLLNFADAPGDDLFRQELKALERRKPGAVYDRLVKSDPKTAAKIHPNDIRRVIRALEIQHLSGKPKSELMTDYQHPQYDAVLIGLTQDRQELYRRIEKRVDDMLKNGLVNEVKHLLAAGVPRNAQSMQAIGYKEIAAYLAGETTLESAAELIKRNTRRFAKRQITWFKRNPAIYWYDPANYTSYDDMFVHILQTIKERLKAVHE